MRTKNLFACISDEHADKDHKGEVKGTVPKRGLFYNKYIGKHRIYRRNLDDPGRHFRLIRFKTEDEAQQLCDEINGSVGQDFRPVNLNTKQFQATVPA